MSRSDIIALHEETVEYQKLNFQADSDIARTRGTRALLGLLLETTGVSEEAAADIVTFMTMARVLVIQPGFSG